MDHDDSVPSSKDHARSKYHHGRLPLFNNKTRGAHTCMVTVGHESRVCDAKGMWSPSRTSQAAHDAQIAAAGRDTAASDQPHGRRKSGSVSSSDEQKSASPTDGQPRMHYEKPVHRHQSKQATQRTSKEMSHHRDRIQRREDLSHGL